MNCYSSVKHNHDFNSGMTTCFGLTRPSSRYYYKNYKIRFNTLHKHGCVGQTIMICFFKFINTAGCPL